MLVSDTGPINYLVQIEAIEILPKLFGGLWLPSAVLSELRHPKSLESLRTWASAPPPWVTVVDVIPNLDAPALDLGERCALQLALDQGAFLLVDERPARRVAAQFAIPHAGTIGLLKSAHHRGLIDFPQTITRLRQTNCFLPEPLIDSLLASILQTPP